ncbi:MAG: metal dependent phosphohydrolase, partial [Acidimicrobiaceae bacterium]|nr:metal dependent phosphohydrolase [Acidimicrobiaceae bacterium]
MPDAPAKESLTLRPARDALAAELLAGKLSPWSFARAYSDAADSHVQALFESATGGRSRGYCLLAVGGYGRGELCPGSDLDLVLLHRGRRRYKEVAQAIWYSLWDEGLRLDHSVRTRSEALAMAKEDLKVALGLLDARVVAGDPAPAEPLLREVRQVWVRQSSTYLKELAEVVAVRHQRSGELAFLLEPDLKQSAGGLRDASALRAIRLALPEVEAAEDPEVQAEADALITATRCALQCRTRSNGDRLVLQEQDVIAPLLNFHDADALMAALAEAGRTITAGLDEAWHRTRVSGRQGASREGELSVEQGIVV